MSVKSSDVVDRYYNTKELAQLLGTTVGTLQQWRHRGQGPQPTRLNGAIRYAATAVNTWIAQQNPDQQQPQPTTLEGSTPALAGTTSTLGH